MKRLTINIPEDLWDELSQRAEARAITVTELVRRALALDAYVEQRREEGEKVYVADSSNDNKRELVMF